MARQVQNNEIISRLVPLGDRAILVRFGNQLNLQSNQNAQSFAQLCRKKLSHLINGCSSNLVSVTLHYDPFETSFSELKNQIMLLMGSFNGPAADVQSTTHVVDVRYGGECGPCLKDVCQSLGMTEKAFIQSHTGEPLHALALGFSPGFLYLGLHDENMLLPRRETIQENVPAGSILFAAGQSAITSRPIRTGWHVIGQTNFRNFNPESEAPITINPSDLVQFNEVQAL